LVAAASLTLLVAGAACSNGNNGYASKAAPAAATQLAATQAAATVGAIASVAATPPPTVAASLPAAGSATASPAASVAPTSAATPPGASGAQMAVTIGGFAFAPATLHVPVGATVIWTNNDAVTHTVTPDAGGIADHQLAAGTNYSQTFANAGTYSYHCSIHPFMKGTIVVGG